MFPYAKDPIEGDVWQSGTPCATPGCENNVTFPDFEAFCSACIQEQRNAQHRAEAAADRRKGLTDRRKSA